MPLRRSGAVSSPQCRTARGGRLTVVVASAEAVDVDVLDGNVLADIDDPEAYQRIFGVLPPE